MQTKTHSLIETVTNIGIGYFIAIISQVVIFPMFGIEITLKNNLLLGFYFTVISFIRGYIIRRVFNRLNNKTKRT